MAVSADGPASCATPAPCAIGVMAKVPRAGRSKTRLCPPLAPAEAAALSAAFLRDTTEAIAAAARAAAPDAAIAGYAAYAPAGDEAALAPHLASGIAPILADGETGAGAMPDAVRGFGRCLLHAIRAMLGRGHAAAAVLSSDSPSLPAARLVEAARLLARPGDRAVLGAADDGGYYLLGLKAPHAALFADIAWSTDTVAAATRARAAAIGLELVELEPWYDVDDAAALDRLAGEAGRAHAPGAAPLDATRAALARLGIGTGPAGRG